MKQIFKLQIDMAGWKSFFTKVHVCCMIFCINGAGSLYWNLTLGFVRGLFV